MYGRAPPGLAAHQRQNGTKVDDVKKNPEQPQAAPADDGRPALCITWMLDTKTNRMLYTVLSKPMAEITTQRLVEVKAGQPLPDKELQLGVVATTPDPLIAMWIALFPRLRADLDRLCAIASGREEPMQKAVKSRPVLNRILLNVVNLEGKADNLGRNAEAKIRAASGILADPVESEPS